MSRSLRIVITGATRGLGRAMTGEFSRLDHTVIGCGRSPHAVEELQALFPASHRFDVVDVSVWNLVEAWANSVIDAVGPPDLLINNAALINRNAVLWEVPPDEFARLVDVNINGVFYVLRAFVPAMVESRSGVIVNFSSGWGRSTSPEVAPYCATKWAIEGLTKTLAQELPRGMAAVPLNPGVIDTDMLRSTFGSMAEAYPAADEWAKRAVPFLLQLDSDDNGVSHSVP